MTDVSEGSGHSSGNLEGSTAAAPNGLGAGGGSDFLSVLSEGNREVAEAKGWTSPDKVNAMIESYSALEKKQGSSLTMPGENATPEERAAFFDKASSAWAPQSGDGYHYAMPAELPADFAYNQDFVTEASGWFHEAKLTPTQAQFLHDKWVGQMAGAHTQMGEHAALQADHQATQLAEANRVLQRSWGPKGSEAYETNLGKAVNAAERLGIMEDMVEMGHLAEDGHGNRKVLKPSLVEKLVKVNNAMFAEDSLGATGGSSVNPFAKDTLNLTAQTKILRDNPSRAASLLKAAGKDPAKYGLSN
ncbi:MAG: hypothetical protein JKY34_09245 [Kordiimonadaceae bacterium]|nr:hypothetical protein [Kordiimonadaceae bacterium]